MKDQKANKQFQNSAFKGILIILLASFIWGVGNFITGYTANKYIESKTLFPAIDIALSNTLGGIFFLSFFSFFNNGINFRKNKTVIKNKKRERKITMLSGFFKGANTCLFVFSTTFIVATEALILENTYIIWSLLFVFFSKRKISHFPLIIQTLILGIGLFLITNHGVQINKSMLSFKGLYFGLGAGLSYALFLFFWSEIAKELDYLEIQLKGTLQLLLISIISISLFTWLYSLFFLNSFWIPFRSLEGIDLLLQFINGIFVVGLTYLLITVGMNQLKNTLTGSAFITALGLSFAVPFTLLPEFIIGKFIPTTIQIIGVIFFMVGFTLINSSLNRIKY